MALESALVDRARAIRMQAQPRRVAGRTLEVPVYDAWFDARLELPRSPESPGPSGGRRRVERSPSLMYGFEDDDGKEVILTRETRVEVESDELGTAVWEVSGHPEPMRKKEEVIGWVAPITRVEDVEVERDAAPFQAVGASLGLHYNVEEPIDERATAHLGIGQY